MVVTRRPPDIPRLLSVLEMHSVRYVLTGSVAAHIYGVQIGEPGNLDITPALDRDNLQHMAAALRMIEARIDPDEPAGHWEAQPDGERKWIVDETTPELVARRTAWFPDPDDISTLDHLFITRFGNLDVVPELSGTYDDLKQRALEFQAYGQKLWVAHVDDLLAALTVPRRQKDVSRVRQLRTLQRSFGQQ